MKVGQAYSGKESTFLSMFAGELLDVSCDLRGGSMNVHGTESSYMDILINSVMEVKL